MGLRGAALCTSALLVGCATAQSVEDFGSNRATRGSGGEPGAGGAPPYLAGGRPPAPPGSGGAAGSGGGATGASGGSTGQSAGGGAGTASAGGSGAGGSAAGGTRGSSAGGTPTAMPTCDDRVKNGSETDVDCGGSNCRKCIGDEVCASGADCESTVCSSRQENCILGLLCQTVLRCEAATCEDGIANGDETDVDCGGGCPACPAGSQCGEHADCESGPCGDGGVCQCTPIDTCPAAAECGVIDDGCGGTIGPCGDCSGGDSCVETTCVSVPAFGYAPSHFDPTGNALDPTAAGLVTNLDCGESVFDSEALSFENWCGETPPTPVVEAQAGGPDVVILPMLGLDIASDSTLRIVGDRPVILAVYGDATVAGTLDASGSGAAAGPGGNTACGASAGTAGTGNDGGGGAGYGTAGAGGGNGTNGTPGTGGVPRGDAALAALLGGCPGGAGSDGANGGGGGGAVQLSVAGSLSVSGWVLANGGNGANGARNNDGGGGGGSGGAILLEADALSVDGTVTANGGDGGEGGDGADAGPGGTASRSPGVGGNAALDGGGGGGGAVGRIRLNGHTSCGLPSPASPAASESCP